MDSAIRAQVVVSLENAPTGVRFGPDSKKVLYLAIEDLQKGGRAKLGAGEPCETDLKPHPITRGVTKKHSLNGGV
jgi:hypothetical protein